MASFAEILASPAGQKELVKIADDILAQSLAKVEARIRYAKAAAEEVNQQAGMTRTRYAANAVSGVNPLGTPIRQLPMQDGEWQPLDISVAMNSNALVRLARQISQEVLNDPGHPCQSWESCLQEAARRMRGGKPLRRPAQKFSKEETKRAAHYQKQEANARAISKATPQDHAKARRLAASELAAGRYLNYDASLSRVLANA